MATRRYGLAKGETEFEVLEEVGAPVVNNSIELTFDLAAGHEQQDILLALDMFKNHILKGNFPPA